MCIYDLNLVTLILLVSLVGYGQCGGGGGSPYTKKGLMVPERNSSSIYIPLVEHLFEPYVPLAMPVCKKGEKMLVNLDTWLYQLFDLDEPTQMLTIDVWLEMSWTDCGLTWNPAEYNGINQISVPAGTIWHPDVIYYQSLHGNFEEGVFLFGQSVARIRNDGKVQLGTQALLKSFCRVKISDFPYDSQSCNLTFSSWNKDASVFQLRKRDGHGDQRGHSFKDSSNGEWDVMGFPAYNSISSYVVGGADGIALNYTEVTFQLNLRRKPTYIKVYLIFPCVLLVWVASFVFILPVECGEKIGLSVTVMLSLMVFLLLVADNIPRSSDGIPILGIFFSMSIGLVCLSVLFTSIVLNVGTKTPEICVPKWIRKVMMSRLNIIFCFRYNAFQTNHKWVSFKVNQSPVKMMKKRNGLDGDGEAFDESASCPNQDCSKNDWRYFAILLDRFFLVIYVLLALILTLYIYLQEPDYSKQEH